MYALKWNDKQLAKGDFAHCWESLAKYVEMFEDDPSVKRVARLFAVGMRIDPIPEAP